MTEHDTIPRTEIEYHKSLLICANDSRWRTTQNPNLLFPNTWHVHHQHTASHLTTWFTSVMQYEHPGIIHPAYTVDVCAVSSTVRRTKDFTFPLGEKNKTKQPLIPSRPVSSQWKGLQKGGREARMQTGNPLGQVVGASSFHSHSPLPPTSITAPPPQCWQASPSRNRKAIWCLFGTVRRQDVLCCVSAVMPVLSVCVCQCERVMLGLAFVCEKKKIQ